VVGKEISGKENPRFKRQPNGVKPSAFFATFSGGEFPWSGNLVLARADFQLITLMDNQTAQIRVQT